MKKSVKTRRSITNLIGLISVYLLGLTVIILQIRSIF